MRTHYPIIESNKHAVKENVVILASSCIRCHQVGHIAHYCPMLIPQYLNNIVNILNKMSPGLVEDSSYVPDKSGWTVPQFIGMMQNCQRSITPPTSIRPFLLFPVSIICEKKTDIIQVENVDNQEIVVHKVDTVNEVNKEIPIKKDPVRHHIESNLPVKQVTSFPAHAVCFCNLCRQKNLAPTKWVQYTCGHGNCQDCVSSILKNRVPFEDADTIKCFCCGKISHHIYILN